MPALFVFLLKVNIALLLFCAGYYLVLRHLTFYTLNRVYLVGAIIFATVYPRINLDGFAQRHQRLTRPVQIMVSSLQAPAETLVKPLTQPIYWYWAEVLFFAGAAFLAMRLSMQLFSLYKVYRASKSANILGHSVRIIDGNGGPFSFWKNIYINPASYEVDELRSILQHEQVHTDELHTLDVLLAELSVIFYWFNPGVWLMRKAVRENIEFITDRNILQKGIDSKQYQYSLLSVSVASTQPGIANHFNISTLKKRIMMMNAKRSSKAKLTRYALLVPILLICLFSFSFSKAELVKKSKKTFKMITNSVVTITSEAAEKLDVKVAALFQQKTATKNHGADAITLKRQGFIAYTYQIRTDTINSAIHLKIDTIKTLSMQGGPIKVLNLKQGDTIKKGIRSFVNFSFITGNSATGTMDTIRKKINFNVGVKNGSAIFIDGVKVSGIDAIDPNTIATYDITRTKENPDGIIVITTKKGAKDKPGFIVTQGNHEVELKDMLVLNDDRIKKVVVSVPNAEEANDDKVAMVKKIMDFKTMVRDTTVYKKGQKPRVVTMSGHPIVVTNIDHKDSLLKRMINLSVSKDGRVIQDTTSGSIKEITVMGYNTRRGMPGTQKNSETSINDLAGKLVIVDGVEATDKDLKVSAINIKSIAIKSGDEMIKKYGDKAKNGVVFITTTKAK